jgi:D-alanyl-D-alanine carboxypeptidase
MLCSLGSKAEAFGTRRSDGKEPIDVNDHFRVGSITKTWTGTVILQLVREGRLKLSDPISAYISEVPNGDGGRPVRIKQTRRPGA